MKPGIGRQAAIGILCFTVFSCLSIRDSRCSDLCFDKPIPACKVETDALSYHDVPVDRTHPLFTEPLVELKTSGIIGEAYYGRRDKLNYPYCRALAHAQTRQFARGTVVKKLKQVNASLAEQGLELFVFDAFRPVQLQSELWHFFLDEAARRHPAFDEAEKIRFAGKYCSNPAGFSAGDFRTWPTHCTGGAVDLTLCRKNNGEQLYMGSIFDDASEISHTDYFEDEKHRKTQSDYAARQNRRLLYWAMRSAGFVNYPKEWWHFDYGTQMSVYNARAAGQVIDLKAIWGPAQRYN